MNIKKLTFLLYLVGILSFSQETLPIYSDYLTDNFYLLHPASAGISDIAKLRITARKQWSEFDNSPQLQTASFHMHLGESESAIGAIIFNDKVGHFSKTGLQMTYAYHIPLDYRELNQLSFGISLNLLQNSLDGRDFILQDSDIDKQLMHYFYFNSDVGFGYRYKGLFAFYTVKNLLLSKRNIIKINNIGNNLRSHLLNIGYHFNQGNSEKTKFEPSILLHYREKTKESFMDLNLRTFIPINNSELWFGLSYRKGLDQNSIDNANYFTPFLGIKFSDYVVSYTYSKQLNNILFSNGSFHQITLGYNFRIRKYRTASWDL